MFFRSHSRRFGPLCKFQHNIKISIKTACISRLSVSYDYVGTEQIQVVPSVDILAITRDDKLNFDLHIDKVCLKSANQLNALVRLKLFLRNEEIKILLNSFVLSNFSYYPLVWMLTNMKLYIKSKLFRKETCVLC